jgi:short-subunit dehydrogenase
MYFTLITGASSGMGKEMAYILAEMKRNIILISLPNENVAETAGDIANKFGVTTDFYECDLTKFDTGKALFDWTQSKGYKINFLINNAGIGNVGRFEEHSFNYINLMMDLNMRAATHLTYYFLPQLKENAPSHLLNTSSMIANMPMPYKTLYSSTKVYVKYLTIALREEFAPMGISVSLFQPGATPTTDIVKDQIANGGFFARISASSVEYVAREAITKTLKGKAIIIPGFKNKLALFLVKLIPWPIRIVLLRNQGRRMVEK